MKYELNDEDEVVDIWFGVFEALSTSLIDLFWQDLGLSVQPTADVKAVAQSFVTSCFTYLGRQLPWPPQIDLFLNPSDDELETIWRNAFLYLENKLGPIYADAVYQWGRQTYKNYDNHDNQVINPIHWWSGLITDWTKKPASPGFVPLDLPQQTALALQAISYYIRYKIPSTYIANQRSCVGSNR